MKKKVFQLCEGIGEQRCTLCWLGSVRDGLPVMLDGIGLPSCIVSNTHSSSIVPSLVQRFGLSIVLNAS